jgi:hypothetical protein
MSKNNNFQMPDPTFTKACPESEIIDRATQLSKLCTGEEIRKSTGREPATFSINFIHARLQFFIHGSRYRLESQEDIYRDVSMPISKSLKSLEISGSQNGSNASLIAKFGENYLKSGKTLAFHIPV